jgi:antitoxin component of MazEF toxin-antitoxin module
MLTRKARKVGTSIVLTLPSQLVELFDIQDGEEMFFSYEKGRIIIERVLENDSEK